MPSPGSEEEMKEGGRRREGMVRTERTLHSRCDRSGKHSIPLFCTQRKSREFQKVTNRISSKGNKEESHATDPKIRISESIILSVDLSTAEGELESLATVVT
jgi:hypothetical protein